MDTALVALIIISTTLMTGPVEIVVAEVQLDQYLGCFYDGETQPEQLEAQLRGSGVNRADLTVGICLQHCHRTYASKGVWSYAILQNSTECRCSNNYCGRQVKDSFCRRTCGGKVSEYCGGTYENGNSTDVFYVLYVVCPIGTYDEMCDKECHCKSQVPCDRQTGRCPSGCHGNYTGEQCNQLTSFSDQYIGCYRDHNDDRAMEKLIYAGGRNTLQDCLSLCSSKYSYAGPQHRGECWCGESYDKHGRIADGYCDNPCNGDKSQFCGGEGAISVYRTCPSGKYGPNCANVCNCEGSCHFKHGTCLKIGCKPGWKGDACNIRDINERLETPTICGSFSKYCNNNTNGNVVQNSAIKQDNNSHVNNVGAVVGAVVGWVLFLIAVIIIIGILFMHKRERHHDKSDAAPAVSSSGLVPEINRNADNATNPESRESAYACLDNRIAYDSSVYEVPCMQT